MSAPAGPVAAIDRVDDEQSVLEQDIRSFAEFRESFRLISPDAAAVKNSDTASELRSAYRTEVMEPTDYEATYGDTVADSLQMEFDATTADTLLAADPITHKRKRRILVKAAHTIERREQFRETLSTERDALTSFRSDLATVQWDSRRTAAVSATGVSFDRLASAWETYNQLEQRCNHPIERRQHQLTDTDRRIQFQGTTHGLATFLEENHFRSRYPVLTKIANAVDRITTNRESPDSAQPASRSMTD